MFKVYFASKSEEKFREIREIISIEDWDKLLEVKKWPEELSVELPELQTENDETLVKNKALAAFKMLRRPVMVEHTALRITALNQLPGLHTNYFYTKLGYEEIVKWCGIHTQFEAVVESIICVCDGHRYWIGKGMENGEIVKSVENIKETDGFGWDIIFIPGKDNPDKKTYAELKDEKSHRSMRKLAWNNLILENPQFKEMIEQKAIGLENKESLQELAELIANGKVMLFVGAGISASINFPSWEGLIDKLAEELEYEPELFKSYGDYMMLAEYAKLTMSGELYQQLNDTFTITEEVKSELMQSEIYRYIREFNFPVIYTTNYDSLIETYFKEKGEQFSIINDISQMGKMISGKPRIMKYHGELGKEESIVLSESQYFERMNFQSYMDIQLQADMLRYNILFLGYSLSDINIKLLWYLARKRWEKNYNNNAIKGMQKAYIYTATPNDIQKEVFGENGIISFGSEETNKKIGTLRFLEELNQEVQRIKISKRGKTEGN